MILLDVGVWLAAVWGRHVHHPEVRAWFDEQDRALVFCRVTQMGVLRLLSTPSIMGGDVLTRSECWGAVDRLLADERVLQADEPQHLELTWRALSNRDDTSHKLWTDDYLAAFAQAADMPIATVDRAFARRHASVRVETLG
jgi:toxin-antitoxin system PIN domain toxin